MTTPVISLDEISESQSSKYATHNQALRQIETRAIVRVAQVTAVDMTSAAGKTDLFVVPSSYKFIPTHVIIRDPSTAMTGGSNYSFGDGTAAENWTTGVDLSSLSTAGGCRVISNNNSDFIAYDGGDTFGIYSNATGASTVLTVVADVFGYVYSTST